MTNPQPLKDFKDLTKVVLIVNPDVFYGK